MDAELGSVEVLQQGYIYSRVVYRGSHCFTGAILSLYHNSATKGERISSRELLHTS